MKSYIWREGDRINAVCERLGLDARAVSAANPDVCFDSLSSGDIIKLPAPVMICRRGFHVVASGQSMCSIARMLGVSCVSLVNANPYADPSALTVGEVLAAPEREYCRARLGDGLIDIAGRFGVAVWRLAALNPKAGNGVLKPGMTVRLR